MGRYAIYGEVASGGMATVHFGRLVGQVGFSRTVAIKRLHPQFAKDPDFVSMFVDEARLAARIQHPNVVPTLDIVALEDELFLVMEYVQGEALSKLIRAARRANQTVPLRVALSIMAGALHGLHAAHEAKSERGQPLGIVHRDVSPQNILVGTDGVSRVLDFGVAKAAMRATSTRDGQMKGKIAYMAPEQMRGKEVDRRTDVFAAGIVLWEALTGRRLFDGNDPGEVLTKLLEAEIPPPSTVEASIPQDVDQMVMRALRRQMDGRYATAREFAVDLENSGYVALPRKVGEWVEEIGGDSLNRRAEQVAEIESVSSHVGPHIPTSSPAPSVPIPYSSNPPRDVPSQVTSPSQVRHSHLSSPSAVTGVPGTNSNITVGGFDTGAKKRSVLAALVGVAAALGIAFLVVLFVFIQREPSEGNETPAVAAPHQAAPATLPPPAEVTTPPSAAEAPPSSPPAPSPPPAPTPKTLADLPKEEKKPPKVYPPPRPTAKTPPTPAPAPAPAPKPNCNPPYIVDSKGVKRPKLECL
ncbi:MAG: serine/threonine-protein kinase [Polyangiaceae bacterium]